jgi:hypothetical protein
MARDDSRRQEHGRVRRYGGGLARHREIDVTGNGRHGDPRRVGIAHGVRTGVRARADYDQE